MQSQLGASPLSPTPIALSIPAAAKASDLSRSLLYEAIKDGSLKTLKVGERRLVMVTDLEEWLLRHRVR